MNPTEAKIELNNLLTEHPYRSLDSARTRKAIKTAMKALDKQVPRKPALGFHDESLCPFCKSETYDPFCGHCGQALDWEGTK